MENLLECNICLEKYDNKEKIPRILKCGHTFCTKCLKEFTKVNSSIELNFPFVKCPIDKTIGHPNTNIDEIPINRIVVDVLDYNGFQFDKLTLRDDKTEKLSYINSALEKLKNLDKYFNTSYNIIRDNILNFMNIKNNAVGEISQHFDKIISMLENQKQSSIHQIDKYSKDKINIYNEVLQSLDKHREIAHFKIERLEMVKNQKSGVMSIADEIEVLNSMGIDNMDFSDYQREVDKIKEDVNEAMPKAMIKQDIEPYVIELVNSVKIILPNQIEQPEMFALNEELESLNIESSFVYWFQQNSKNVYKKNLNDSDWILTENKDNYVFKEMFRVCMLSNEEALLTGGGQGFMCSSMTVHFCKGFLKKKQNMFTERRSHSTCKSGDFVFACGGINSKGEPLAACEKFSLTYEKWIKCSNMNFTKSHLSLCSVNNQFVYSIGGENKFQSLLDVIEKYNIQTDLWEVINLRLPNKIECCACTQFKNEILILGGYSCENGSNKSVISYDFVKNTIKYLEKDLDQPGWSIYQPIRQGRDVHVFYGGEEGYPPHHIVYQIA